MTALVLPLLDIDVNSVDSLGELWTKYGNQFSAFLLSFFIIALFWMVHHKVWFALRSVTATFLWLNLLWLLGILLIPFVSITVYETDDFPTLGFQLYAAVVFFVSATLGLMIYLIFNRPELNRGDVVPTPLWYALRYAAWWLVVLAACIINAEGIGQYLLEWSAIPMVILGVWRPASMRKADAQLRARGVVPVVE